MYDGTEIPFDDEHKYVYNFFGHPSQHHKNNKFQISFNLTIVGGRQTNNIWSDVHKKIVVVKNLLQANGIIEKKSFNYKFR